MAPETNDIVVEAFGKRNIVRRDVLAKSKYLSGLTPRNDGVLVINNLGDELIGVAEVDQALQYLQSNGQVDTAKEEKSSLDHLGGMIAIARIMGIKDLEQDYVSIIKRTTTTANAAATLKFFSSKPFGSTSLSIQQDTTQILKYLGTDMTWDTLADLPSESIREILADDGFYAQDELARCLWIVDMYYTAARHGNTSVQDDLQYVLNHQIYYTNIHQDDLHALSLKQDATDSAPLIRTDLLLNAIYYKYNEDHRKKLRFGWRRGEAIVRYVWWSENSFAIDGRLQELYRVKLDAVCPSRPERHGCGAFRKTKTGEFVNFAHLEGVALCQPDMEDDARHETGRTYQRLDAHLFTLGEESSTSVAANQALSFSRPGSEKVIVSLDPPTLYGGIYGTKPPKQ